MTANTPTPTNSDVEEDDHESVGSAVDEEPADAQEDGLASCRHWQNCLGRRQFQRQ